MATNSFYHLFYGSKKYGQIEPKLWKEEKFSVSVKDETIKVNLPDETIHEFSTETDPSTNRKFDEVCIVQIDYDEKGLEIDKKMIARHKLW